MKIGEKHILLEYKPIGSVQSPLGELVVFSISYGDMAKARTHRGLSVKGVEPMEFVHVLLQFILHKKDQLREDADSPKPDGPTLTEQEVRSLPEDVIESAIEYFIADQEYLYKQRKSEVKTNDKGEQVHSLSYNDVKYPRQENETNVQYLHRLVAIDEEASALQMAKIVGAAKFSAGLNENIKNTLQMGDSMRKTINAFQSFKLPDISVPFHGMNIGALNEDIRDQVIISPTPTSLPLIDFSAMAKSAEESRWAPFDSVNERLDELVDLTTKSSQFMVQMNQTQTQIAAEIKASSEESSKIGTNSLKLANDSVKIADDSLKIARRGFWIATVVGGLTLLGFVISTVSWRESGDTTQKADKRSEQIVLGVSELKNAVVDNGQLSSRDITAVLTELKAARKEQASSLEVTLNDLSKALDFQSQQLTADRNVIEALNSRMTQLENQLHNPQPTSAPK